VADLHDVDPVTAANRAIRDHIRALPEGRITPEARPEYERLVDAYFAAVRDRDADRGDVPLAA
jgi:hypothetical protein